jgi:uncharacterized hydrophobic protein (TIGR00271 family)
MDSEQQADRRMRDVAQRARAAGDQIVSVAGALAASPVVWRAAVAAAGLLVFVLLPSGDEQHFDEILGFVLIGIGIAEQMPRLFGGPPAAPIQSLVISGLGAVMLVWPNETESVIGLITAAAILYQGLRKLWAAVRQSDTSEQRWDRLSRGALMTTVGLVVLVFPDSTARLILVLIGLALVFEALLIAATIGRLGPTTLQDLSLGSTEENLLRWLARRRVPVEDRDRIDETLFYEGDAARRRTFRFITLMFLATSIATFGIASDSTAVVIGAMLIAPLMTPILATSAALLNGWPRRAGRAALLVASGIAGAIAFSWLLALMIPNLIAVVENSQVTSRTSPNLIDLAIAMAAGAAGAFAISRSDVSDTLPGVAVAIALVPPLAVVGVTLRAGDVQQSLGALLLFATNLVSIIITASLVFVLTGYASLRKVSRESRRLRTSYSLVGVGLVLLVIPLGLTGRAVIDDAKNERSVQHAVDDWLGEDTEFRVERLEVEGRTVDITLLGPGEPPAATELHDTLKAKLGDDTVLEMRIVPEDFIKLGGD